MFEQVDFNKDVDSIIAGLDRNCDVAKKMRKQIRELKENPGVMEFKTKEVEETTSILDEAEDEEELDEEMEAYIHEYRTIQGDDEESLVALLPDPEDYSYTNIIYRLQAESLREIKEMTEIMVEEGDSFGESKTFIENEKKKISLLSKLLEIEEEKEEQEVQKNNIILAPLESGRIRFLDDLDTIPREYYGRIIPLINSMIDGSFRRFKRFNYSSNNALASVCEVRGQGIRIIFKRLNNDTYAIVTAFLKKTDNDRGYQEYMRTVIAEYQKVEDCLKANLNNPKFMKLQEDYIKEMWTKLGIGETSKKYGKGGLV